MLPDPDSIPHARRLEKLEELQTFAEHRSDQLGEQVAVLAQSLRDVEQRLRRLEDGLGRLDERVTQVGAPLPSDPSPPPTANPLD